jgi:hypothetical protein
MLNGCNNGIQEQPSLSPRMSRGLFPVLVLPLSEALLSDFERANSGGITHKTVIRGKACGKRNLKGIYLASISVQRHLITLFKNHPLLPLKED